MSVRTRFGKTWLVGVATTVLAVGCSAPDGILIELAPEVISSQEGTLHAQALVMDGQVELRDEGVIFSISYIDRNGVEHAIDDVEDGTNKRGEAEAIFEGLMWEGVGTVTATVDGDDSIVATATFTVLDLTPPTVTILPPTEDLRVGPGFPLEISVEVTDEIGVSEVFLEGAGELDRLRSTVVASGSTEATVRFDFDIPDGARSGPTITLYALASDLSGNQAAAEPVVLTVDPTIAFATTEGLMGQILSDGSGQFLDNPEALALSPKNGALYVADNSAGSPCNDACIRRVDPATGVPEAGVVYSGNGTVSGVAFDAAGDTMYVSDRQSRLLTLSYNDGNGEYETPTACNDFGADNPQDPMHIVIDATLGLLVPDSNDQRVKQMATCDGGEPGDFTDSNFDRPWGIAAGAAGEFYVSDEGDDRIYSVASNGDISFFEDRDMNEPHGLAWLAGGATAYADSLMVANYNHRTITSTVGPDTARAAIYLRNRPVDIEIASGTMYILTEPSAGDEGRVLVVTGF